MNPHPASFRVRQALADMRSAAMEYRQAIHPDAYFSNLAERGHHGAFYLRLAIQDRNRAQQNREHLKRVDV